MNTIQLSDLSEQEQIAQFRLFRKHFDSWVTEKIRCLVGRDNPIGNYSLEAFILMSCAIDWLAGFWYGENKKGKAGAIYKTFVKEYFPASYKPQDLWDSLRNGLVHSWTINNKNYALTDGKPEDHLKQNGKWTMLNAENFFRDWEVAKNKYFDSVEQSPELLKKWVTHVMREGYLGLS